MEYRKVIQLKDGRMCVLRNGTEEDGSALLDIFLLTHSQTDFFHSLTAENMKHIWKLIKAEIEV